MAEYRLWPATDGPATDEANPPINLGTEFNVSTTAWITKIHFWRATLSEVGPVTGAVYAVVGATQLSGTAVTFTLSGVGWHTVTLPTPVQITAGVRYIATIRHADHYAGTGGYFTSGPGSAGITNGILTAPSAAAVSSAPIGNGRFDEAGAIAAPTSTFNGGNYWSDVSVTDVDPGGRSGTAIITATSSLTSTGAKGGRGTGTILGASALADNGRTGRTGTATILGTGTAASTGRAARAGTALLTATALLADTGRSGRAGTATTTGTAAITSTGRNPDNISARLYRAGEPTTTWSCGPPLT